MGISNAVTFMTNAFKGLGTYLTSFFDQLGGVLASRFAKSFADKIPDFAMNLIKRFDPEVAAGIKALKGQEAPGFAPNTSGLTRAALNRGTEAMPGFRNPFAALPNRSAEIDPLMAGVNRERARMNRGPRRPPGRRPPEAPAGRRQPVPR